jgi:anaerobic dimethyl sulfoxide reductase subunit A
MIAPQDYDRIVWSTCNVNCGSRCPLRLFVKKGRVVRIEPDNTGDPPDGPHEIRACLRGRGLRRWVDADERLLHPLKRAGKRGEGRFERISWDQALDHIAAELDRIIRHYGNEAVFRIYGTGNLGGVVSSRDQIDRLMHLLGGRLDLHNSYSTAQITHAMQYTYGEKETGNPISDLVNSRLAVFFGNNPAETRMSGGGTIRDLVVAKQKKDVRIIVIDPRHTDTAASFADEWIPIRPGTDAALVGGLAYVLISEGLVDQDFLHSHCLGYDTAAMPAGVPPGNSYKDYIQGKGPDGTPKTPEWAAGITGIPAERITRLAREIGIAKPAYISQGWGPQRHAGGEQSARAICMLPILTGNVGLQGGNSGDREGPFGIDFPGMPVGGNPVKTSIPCFMWTKAIDDPHHLTALNSGLLGKDRLETGIKFLWSFASNILMNQHADLNRTKEILGDENKCEMIVVIDNMMTASARYADIVLPATSTFEESDLCYQSYGMALGALMLRQKAIEPMGESRTLFDICAAVAERMGVAAAFTEGRTHDHWVTHLYHECRKIKPELPEDFRDAVRKGIFKWAPEGKPRVGLKKFRDDPIRHPLRTPSGKIEIFSPRLWQMSRTWELPEGDMITALPEYHPTWGDPGAPESTTYPLQCVGHHYKQRTHSSYGNNPWLEEAAPQMVWMNPLDAADRDIHHGDRVRIFNRFGETRVRVKVTPRIMPGVLSLPQGAWHHADQEGIDQNGCINVLTRQRPSPLAKGNPQHSNLVQVAKLEEAGDA